MKRTFGSSCTRCSTSPATARSLARGRGGVRPVQAVHPRAGDGSLPRSPSTGSSGVESLPDAMTYMASDQAAGQDRGHAQREGRHAVGRLANRRADRLTGRTVRHSTDRRGAVDAHATVERPGRGAGPATRKRRWTSTGRTLAQARLGHITGHGRRAAGDGHDPSGSSRRQGQPRQVPADGGVSPLGPNRDKERRHDCRQPTPSSRRRPDGRWS